MKLICDRQALLSGLNLVAGVVPLRTPTPVLSCLKLVAKKVGGVGELTISGTDNETSLQLTLSQVDVAAAGVAVVPADKIRQIVQAVENEPTLTLELEGDLCHIRGTTSRFKIFTQAAEQFPQIPEFSAVASGTGPGAARSVFAQPAGTLLGLIQKTVFATARETSRYAINGVLLKRDGKRLEMVATDSRRLALSRATIKSGDGAAGAAGGAGGATTCIIPTKALNLFARLVTNPEETVRVAITENRVFIAFDDAPIEDKDAKGKSKVGDARLPRAVLSSALVEGAFPPYEDVIPKDQDKRVSLSREEFAAAIRESSILTNEESRGVRMQFSAKGKNLKITSRAPEMGESEIDVALVSYEGEDLEISFNPAFLADALKAVTDSEIMMEMKASNKPGVMKVGNDFLYVVMPVNLPG